MSKRSAKADDEAGVIDLTPMLDVVFIMLIFFIVTATFVKEPGVEVNRPDAVTARQKSSNILIAVTPENKIWINKREIDARQVKNQIQLLLAENPKSGVVVQADTGANIKTLTEVAQAAREAGVEDVSIATDKK